MSCAASTLMISLRTCSECSCTTVISTPNITWKNCFVLNCTKCGNKWYVCPEHNKRFGIKSFYRMNKHFREYHICKSVTNQKGNHITEEENNNGDTVTFLDTEDSCDIKDSHSKRYLESHNYKSDKMCKKAKILQFMESNEISPYFVDEFKEKGRGPCGLVGNAFQMSSKATYAPIQETLFHMELTNFLSNLTVRNQVKIISLLNKSRNIQFHTTRIPRSVKDLNTFYMKSKHSIYKNIQSPSIKAYDNHACVSIEDLINNILCIGLPIQIMRSSQYNVIDFDNSSLSKTQKPKRF